jgi:hypothetical protein
MKIKEILILILLVIPAVLALFKPGFFGASDDMHIAWLQQMDQAISQGQIPPRYVSDLSFGFGYPLFNFIFPLPYYLGEIFHLTGMTFVYSIKAVFIISIIASAFTMYLLARYLAGGMLGIAASVLYVYTPYRATDIYVRGAIGEALAFVFLPLIIYFLIRLSKSSDRNENITWIASGALSITGLILTHNIVSYMYIPFVFILGVVLLRKKIWELIILLLGGLLGSIYFWLPALVDSKLMKYETVFNFFDHFPTLKQLITPYWGYGASVAGNYDDMSFFIGEVNLIVLGLAIIYFIIKIRKLSFSIRQLIIWCLLLVVVSIIMMNFRSHWLWDKIPLIAYFQFPWRFLTMVVFGSSLMTVVFYKSRFYKIIAVFVIILSISINYQRFRPHDYLERSDSYYINRYIPVPTPSEEYLGLEEEYLRLPKMTKIRPKQVYSRIFPEDYISNIYLSNTTDARFTTESDNILTLNYNKYYFPGWEGLIDGERLVMTSGNPYGQVQFTIPSGKHEVVIMYRETGRNRILDWVSLTTVIGCLWVGLKKDKRER